MDGKMKIIKRTKRTAVIPFGMNIRTSTLKNLVIIMILAVFANGLTGCKAKKLAAEKEAQQKILVENTKNRLLAMLDESNTMSVAEMEQELADIKDLEIEDEEVNDLIAQVEAKINRMKAAEQQREEELLRQQREEELRRQREANTGNLSMEQQLEQNFREIAAAGQANNTSQANQKISQTLNYFTSPNALVLIIISRSGDIVDYDEPTTIDKYLNYLKDVGQSKNRVDKVILGPGGKIKELELIK